MSVHGPFLLEVFSTNVADKVWHFFVLMIIFLMFYKSIFCFEPPLTGCTFEGFSFMFMCNVVFIYPLIWELLVAMETLQFITYTMCLK